MSGCVRGGGPAFPVWFLAFICAVGALLALHLWWRRRYATLEGQRQAEIELSHRRQQQTSVDAKAQQQVLFNSMIEGLLLLDRAQKIYLANRAFKNLFGLKVELRGKTSSKPCASTNWMTWSSGFRPRARCLITKSSCRTSLNGGCA